MKYILLVLAFVVLTSINVEYGINRAESDWANLAAAILQAGLIYSLLYKPFKKLLK